MAMSRRIFLRIKKFQIEVVQKAKTHFMFNKFCSEIRAVYEIMSRNVVEPHRSLITIQQGACAVHDG